MTSLIKDSLNSVLAKSYLKNLENDLESLKMSTTNDIIEDNKPKDIIDIDYSKFISSLSKLKFNKEEKNEDEEIIEDIANDEDDKDKAEIDKIDFDVPIIDIDNNIEEKNEDEIKEENIEIELPLLLSEKENDNDNNDDDKLTNSSINILEDDLEKADDFHDELNDLMIPDINVADEYKDDTDNNLENVKDNEDHTIENIDEVNWVENIKIPESISPINDIKLNKEEIKLEMDDLQEKNDEIPKVPSFDIVDEIKNSNEEANHINIDNTIEEKQETIINENKGFLQKIKSDSIYNIDE